MALVSTAASIIARIIPKERVMPANINRSDLGFMAKFAAVVGTFGDFTSEFNIR